MDGILQVVGNEHTVQFFGIRLVGVNGENAKKLAFSVLLILLVCVRGSEGIGAEIHDQAGRNGAAGVLPADRHWVEMSVRFVTREHGIRGVKDAMSREILDGLDEAQIGIASGTYDVVGMPELRVRVMNGSTPVPNPSGKPV